MSVEKTDEQLSAAIMEFLQQKGRWGAHYFPVDTMVNWFGRKVKRNGKRVERTIKNLEEGLPISSQEGRNCFP